MLERRRRSTGSPGRWRRGSRRSRSTSWSSTTGARSGSGRRRASGKELLRRLVALPGFGKQKAQIFVALLGKQLGVRPEGWQEVAGSYAEPGSFRSVADVVDDRSLERVRAFKKEQKAAARR